MADWTYGEDGQRYPVKPGQTWRIGKHEFVCSDLMESQQFDRLLGARATLLYCDPPWGTALVNGFRTKAGLGKATYTWQDLYQRVAAFGTNLPSWIEGSKAESRDGQKIPDAIGATDYVEIAYYGSNPCGLYYRGPDPLPTALKTQMTGMSDEKTPEIVMSLYPHGTVVDPCCGMGATPVAAEKKGWSSVNNDLNGHRISVSMSRLVKLTGLEPEQC